LYVAPTTAEYVPDMHTMHADAPTTSMYSPTPHKTQALGVIAVFVDEALPATHFVHTVLPVAS
jgi:hypothetical protein